MIDLRILYIIIIILLSLIIILWLFTGLTTQIKKNRYNRLKLNEKLFIQNVVYLYKNKITDPNLDIRDLKVRLHNKKQLFWHYGYLFIKINQIIKLSQFKDFETVFAKLELNKSLSSKIRKGKWYEKSRAIMISYELNIEKNVKDIIAYRDDENTILRRESQIALVKFLKWKSLIFFPYVTRTISLWQQIRILEKLQEIDDPIEYKYLDKALRSENEIVKELLIRVIKIFDLRTYQHYLEANLHSENKNLKEQARLVLEEWN